MSDEYTFKRGRSYLWRKDGSLVEWRWYHSLRPRHIWSKITNRFRRHKVVEIDTDRGVITMAYERWSWLQWKWVRK